MTSTKMSATIRHKIKRAVEQTEKPQTTEVINMVNEQNDTVKEELYRMEEHGFVYIVEGEVKLP